MPNHTIIEFQDTHCRAFHWEQTRNTLVLQHALTVPFGTPAASPSKIESISGYDRLKTPEGGNEPELDNEMTDSQVQEANGLALRKALRQAGLHIREALAISRDWDAGDAGAHSLVDLARIEALRHNFADALKGRAVTVFADGGVRTGYDVLKMLALGADGVLVGRDIVRAAVGAGAEGVALQMQTLQMSLAKAMLMTGCDTLADVADHVLAG